MFSKCLIRLGVLGLLFVLNTPASSHPLRLSLCEIEYDSNEQHISVSLRLFLMDVNEALLFDPDNNELAFATANEAPEAEVMLLDYLDEFFHIKVNGQRLRLAVKQKRLSGAGDDTALGVEFEFENVPPLSSLEIKNAVFTDLFFDQNNVVYLHIDDDSKSFMLNKKTSVHTLEL